MATPQVPASTIEASLLFALGSGKTPGPSTSPELPEEMVEGVSRMLSDQGTPALIPQVLETIRAGRQHVERDASLTISAQRYEQVRGDFLQAHGIESSKGRNIWPVGRTTVLKRAGGSWSEALRAAGLGVSTKQRAAGFGTARFSPEQFVAAIGEFKGAAAQGTFTTSYQNYIQWRKSEVERGRTGLPSGPAIRNTYGSWSSAIAPESP